MPCNSQAAAYSPNPLDANLAWHMMTTLQAIGSLPMGSQDERVDDGGGSGMGQEVHGLILSAHLNLVTQLRLMGGMSEWAVYVAMHLPEEGATAAAAGMGRGAGDGLRTGLVKELLTATCPEWRSDVAKEQFLRGQLGLPQVGHGGQLQFPQIELMSFETQNHLIFN